MACDVVVRRVELILGFEHLCPHQLDVVKAFATGRDMLVPLPTGSRKSILTIQTLVNPTYEVLACTDSEHLPTPRSRYTVITNSCITA